MDTRIELQKNDRLSFPGMECTIDHSLGRGSNLIAYVGHYRDHQNPSLSHRVLIRELFPYDREGRIWRDSDGDIHIESGAGPVYDLNRVTFLRGNEVHIRLLEKIPGDLDANINTYEYHNTLYSLVGYTGGRNLNEEFGREQWQDRNAAGTELLLHTVRIIKGALNELQAFHQAGYLHLDISPDNILLIGEGEKERVTLIDYNSVHTINEIEQAKSACCSTKAGFTAPEVRMGRFSRIREWTDLYSMAAVLYVCLTGRTLTTVQKTGNSPVSLDPVEFPFLKDYPETVLSLLHRILRRGLEITPRRRYQSAEQMKADISELEDRILGRGITHWALWEAGRARIRRSLSENPALDYLQDEKRIYPLYAMSEDGKKIPLLLGESSESALPLGEGGDSHTPVLLLGGGGDSHAPVLLLGEGGDSHAPVLLLGEGGTGKTTTLLRIACGQSRRYTPASAVVCYISLYGYRDKEQNYICDRLLESLKFKPHTDSMESARRELMQLLDRPVRRRTLLLLDGLNEAAGDTGPLLEEIDRLSGLAGLQIILTSRTDPGLAGYRKLTLCRLEQEEVKRILSGEGILPPENMEVFDLLTIPMMLAMYIRTVQSREQQVLPDSRDQLIKEYLAAILEKEKGNLPEENSFSMGCEAAVRYLLPEIAGLAGRKKHALSGRELRPLVEACFRELSKRTITTVCPDWIGHTADLRFGARTADEWYGIAVLDLLWKRLGFLVRDEQGNFRIFHQMIEDYLAEKSRQFHKEFDRGKRRVKTFRRFFLLCASLFLVSGIIGYTFFRNAQLAARPREIIRKDTDSLVSMSENALKEGKREEGKRNEAVGAAMQALPPEDPDRQVTAKAEYAGDHEGESMTDASFDSDCFPGSHLEPTGKKMLWHEVLNSRADIKFDDLTGQNLYIFPEQGILVALGEIGEMFLTEDAAYSVSISDLRDFSVSKKYYFSFPDEYSEICGISKDGKTLYFKDFSLDLESGERTEYAGNGTASGGSDSVFDSGDDTYSVDDAGQIIFSKKQFIWEDSEQLYSLEDGKWELENEDGWDGENLHWMFDGKIHTVSFLYEGGNILDHRVLGYYPNIDHYFSQHDIVSGDNGLLFVRCTGREKGDDDLTDVEYFMVYSLETEQWTRIDIPAPYQGSIMPYPAKSSKWFAVGCGDNVLRIYDLEKGEFIRQCSGTVYSADIQNMEYVMQDRYLVVWGKHDVSVFDTSTGDRLFYRKAGTDTIVDDTLSLKVYEDGGDLYFTGKTGFCLDTEEWEIRYDIPWLAAVTDDWILTQEGTVITRYPK